MKEKTGIKYEAYFGSVRFFRHVICLCFFLIVITPYLSMTVLFYQNKLLRSEITSLRSRSFDKGVSPDKTPASENSNIVSSPEYQKKYPDLYCTPRTPFVKKEKAFSTEQQFSDIDPLQGFQIDIDPKGEYVSIYDKYDFDFEPVNKVIKPFEIYDRFYLPKSTSSSKKENGGWLNKYN